MKRCEWCASHKLDDVPYFYVPDVSDALYWLGIDEKSICGYCKNNISRICERTTQNFMRPFNVMEPVSYKCLKYGEIPYEVKIIGWLAYLQDLLRDWVNGRYFKKRWQETIIEGQDKILNPIPS